MSWKLYKEPSCMTRSRTVNVAMGMEGDEPSGSQVPKPESSKGRSASIT